MFFPSAKVDRFWGKDQWSNGHKNEGIPWKYGNGSSGTSIGTCSDRSSIRFRLRRKKSMIKIKSGARWPDSIQRVSGKNAAVPFVSFVLEFHDA